MNKTKKTVESLEFFSCFFRVIYLSANPAILKLAVLVFGHATAKKFLTAW
jgi:hypothetical protein